MKETTSELNATVVVALAVGVLMAFFYFTIWPVIKENFNKTTNCGKAICEPCKEEKCDFVECYIENEPENKFECVYKG